MKRGRVPIGIGERRDKTLGTIRLATVHSVGLYELPASLKEFIRRFPEVNIHVDYKLSDHVYHAVLEGEVDLGLIAYPEARSGIISHPFYEDELVLICNTEHALAHQDSVCLRHLAGCRFVAFESESPRGRRSTRSCTSTRCASTSGWSATTSRF